VSGFRMRRGGRVGAAHSGFGFLAHDAAHSAHRVSVPFTVSNARDCPGDHCAGNFAITFADCACGRHETIL